jgi:hypothetical protein
MIRTDFANRLQPAADLALRPTPPAQEITDRLAGLVVGQRLLAEIQTLLPNGSYRAVIDQRSVTLALPFAAQTGDAIELEVTESDGQADAGGRCRRQARRQRCGIGRDQPESHRATDRQPAARWRPLGQDRIAGSAAEREPAACRHAPTAGQRTAAAAATGDQPQRNVLRSAPGAMGRRSPDGGAIARRAAGQIESAAARAGSSHAERIWRDDAVRIGTGSLPPAPTHEGGSTCPDSARPRRHLHRLRHRRRRSCSSSSKPSRRRSIRGRVRSGPGRTSAGRSRARPNGRLPLLPTMTRAGRPACC